MCYVDITTIDSTCIEIDDIDLVFIKNQKKDIICSYDVSMLLKHDIHHVYKHRVSNNILEVIV